MIGVALTKRFSSCSSLPAKQAPFECLTFEPRAAHLADDVLNVEKRSPRRSRRRSLNLTSTVASYLCHSDSTRLFKLRQFRDIQFAEPCVFDLSFFVSLLSLLFNLAFVRQKT